MMRLATITLVLLITLIILGISINNARANTFNNTSNNNFSSNTDIDIPVEAVDVTTNQQRDEEVYKEAHNGREAYASCYGLESCTNPDCLTASGEVFDENAPTMACNPRFPLGARFLLTYQEKTIEVRCNDRGGFYSYNNGQRYFDLSKGVFETLAGKESGVIRLSYSRLD